MPDATVNGTSSGDTSGSETVVTDANGQATVDSNKVRDKKDRVVFTVDSIVHASLDCDSAANTDPDSDSDGTSIVVVNNVTSTPEQRRMALVILPVNQERLPGATRIVPDNVRMGSAAALQTLLSEVRRNVAHVDFVHRPIMERGVDIHADRDMWLFSLVPAVGHRRVPKCLKSVGSTTLPTSK